MGSTTLENTIIDFMDWFMAIIVGLTILGLIYVGFVVIHLRIPGSVDNIFSGVHVHTNTIGELPQKIGDIFNQL